MTNDFKYFEKPLKKIPFKLFCNYQTFAQFNPGIIVVGFCFSMNSDVSWLLRRCGISATMFLTHDLRTITNNPLAELNEVQKQLLKEIGNFIIL